MPRGLALHYALPKPPEGVLLSIQYAPLSGDWLVWAMTGTQTAHARISREEAEQVEADVQAMRLLVHDRASRAIEALVLLSDLDG